MNHSLLAYAPFYRLCSKSRHWYSLMTCPFQSLSRWLKYLASHHQYSEFLNFTIFFIWISFDFAWNSKLHSDAISSPSNSIHPFYFTNHYSKFEVCPCLFLAQLLNFLFSSQVQQFTKKFRLFKAFHVKSIFVGDFAE